MGYVPPALGERMHSLGVVLRGSLTNERWVDFVRALPAAIGMTSVRAPTVDSYPVDGKGGVGLTVFQPLTDSFIVLDTWSDHDGAYLFVSSCRQYYSSDIDAVAATYGLKPTLNAGGRFYSELNLT